MYNWVIPPWDKLTTKTCIKYATMVALQAINATHLRCRFRIYWTSMHHLYFTGCNIVEKTPQVQHVPILYANNVFVTMFMEKLFLPSTHQILPDYTFVQANKFVLSGMKRDPLLLLKMKHSNVVNFWKHFSLFSLYHNRLLCSQFNSNRMFLHTKANHQGRSDMYQLPM